MGRVKIEVIINARSGTGSKDGVEQQLAEAFKAAGVEARVSLAQTGSEVVQLARRAVESEAEIVVAGGGDGTINAVASVVIDTDKVLGVLPFGTMNQFAKDLSVPLDLEGAVETIVAGHETQVDVGDVNGRIFLNNSSLGLYPTIVVNARNSSGSVGASGPPTSGRPSRRCGVTPFSLCAWALTGKSWAVARRFFSSATTNTR